MIEILLWAMGAYAAICYILGAAAVVTEIRAEPKLPLPWTELLCWFLVWVTSPVAMAWVGYRRWKDR